MWTCIKPAWKNPTYLICFSRSCFYIMRCAHSNTPTSISRYIISWYMEFQSNNEIQLYSTPSITLFFLSRDQHFGCKYFRANLERITLAYQHVACFCPLSSDTEPLHDIRTSIIIPFLLFVLYFSKLWWIYLILSTLICIEQRTSLKDPIIAHP